MKPSLAALYAFCIVAASALKIPQGESTLKPIIAADIKTAGVEAVLVGQVLREVARELVEDPTPEDEIGEYFFRKLGEVATKVAGTLVSAAGDVLKGVGGVLKNNYFLTMQENVEDKATKVLTKVFIESADTYSSQDSNRRLDFVKDLSIRLDKVGHRIAETGQRFLDIYDRYLD